MKQIAVMNEPTNRYFPKQGMQCPCMFEQLRVFFSELRVHGADKHNMVFIFYTLQIAFLADPIFPNSQGFCEPALLDLEPMRSRPKFCHHPPNVPVLSQKVWLDAGEV